MAVAIASVRRMAGRPHGRRRDMLRGIEGARMKETYRLAAQSAGLAWRGRRGLGIDGAAVDTVQQGVDFIL